jgi:hypothetical protein
MFIVLSSLDVLRRLVCFVAGAEILRPASRRESFFYAKQCEPPPQKVNEHVLLADISNTHGWLRRVRARDRNLLKRFSGANYMPEQSAH